MASKNGLSRPFTTMTSCFFCAMAALVENASAATHRANSVLLMCLPSFIPSVDSPVFRKVALTSSSWLRRPSNLDARRGHDPHNAEGRLGRKRKLPDPKLPDSMASRSGLQHSRGLACALAVLALDVLESVPRPSATDFTQEIQSTVDPE